MDAIGCPELLQHTPHLNAPSHAVKITN